MSVFRFKGREDWLAARVDAGVGGSEAPAVMGVSRYRSAIDVYADKVGATKPQIKPGQAALFARGHLLEPVIAGIYSDVTGRKVIDRGYNFTRARDGLRFHSLDRYLPKKQFLEIKSSIYLSQHDVTAEGMRVEWWAQMQHGLAVTGYRSAVLAAWDVVSGVLYYDTIERDEKVIDNIIEKETAFMDCVREHTPPKPDGSESAASALGRIYPQSNGAIVQLDAAAAGLADWREDAKAKEKEYKHQGIEASNALKNILGENSVGRLPDGRLVKWENQPREERTQTVSASNNRILRIANARQTITS